MKNNFDEEKHPRDTAGKFNDGNGTTYRQNTSHEDILAADKAKSGQTTKPNYAKYKRRIQSQVFDRISSVRKKLENKGSASFRVYDASNEYFVRLYGAKQNYEYEILSIHKIK